VVIFLRELSTLPRPLPLIKGGGSILVLLCELVLFLYHPLFVKEGGGRGEFMTSPRLPARPLPKGEDSLIGVCLFLYSPFSWGRSVRQDVAGSRSPGWTFSDRVGGMRSVLSLPRSSAYFIGRKRESILNYEIILIGVTLNSPPSPPFDKGRGVCMGL